MEGRFTAETPRRGEDKNVTLWMVGTAVRSVGLGRRGGKERGALKVGG